MKDLGIIIFRTVVGFILLTISMKIMGKREIGQLSIFDFLIVLSIADIMIIGIENFNQSIWNFIVPMILIVLFQKIIAIITLRFTKLRDKIDGKENIIIRKGKIQLDQMEKEKYNMNDLYTQLRAKNIRSIDEVEYAILETNGNLSVFTFEENKDHIFPLPLIISGEIQQENLALIQKTEKWLQTELELQDIYSPKEVYGASYQDGKVKIVQFEKQRDV
ncbi:MAG: DUF421 domain-containing protein [Anaeroplasma bactoclasticum]|nr:DUF421 domain-containing protein [Anaeroplasma bactoclasticum]